MLDTCPVMPCAADRLVGSPSGLVRSKDGAPAGITGESVSGRNGLSNDRLLWPGGQVLAGARGRSPGVLHGQLSLVGAVQACLGEQVALGSRLDLGVTGQLAELERGIEGEQPEHVAVRRVSGWRGRP